MKWIDFERHIKSKNIKLFTPFDVKRFLGRTDIAIRFLLYRLKKQGYIEGVKRGMYKLSGEHIPDLFLANKLYEPSYISLEFALSYYGIIPENVYEITSVTPKTTRRFTSEGKIYSYRSIKKSAYGGYRVEKQKGYSFYIADPEKAFVDTNYFRMIDNLPQLSRFHKEKIDTSKAMKYAKMLENSTLSVLIKTTLS